MGTRELPSFLLWYLHNAAGPKESVVTMATWHTSLHAVEGEACLPCLAHIAHLLPSPDPLPVETFQALITAFLHSLLGDSQLRWLLLNHVMRGLTNSWASCQAQIQLVAVETATVQHHPVHGTGILLFKHKPVYEKAAASDNTVKFLVMWDKHSQTPLHPFVLLSLHPSYPLGTLWSPQNPRNRQLMPGTAGDLQAGWAPISPHHMFRPQPFSMKALKFHRGNLSYWLAILQEKEERKRGRRLRVSCQSDGVHATFNSSPQQAESLLYFSHMEEEAGGGKTEQRGNSMEETKKAAQSTTGPFWVFCAQSIEPTACSQSTRLWLLFPIQCL